MKNKRHGFTLIEVILTIALIGIIIPVIYSVFFAGRKSFEVGVEEVYEQQDYRNFKDYLDNQFKNITYLNNIKPEEYGTYYSLEKIDNNGAKELKRTKYEIIKDEGPIETESIFNIKFNSFEIKYRDRNVIVKFNTMESNSNIEFSIFLENNPSAILNPESNKIFYAYNLNPNRINEDPEIEREWSKDRKYKYGDIVIHGGQRYRSIKKNNNNNKPPKENFWRKIE